MLSLFSRESMFFNHNFQRRLFTMSSVAAVFLVGLAAPAFAQKTATINGAVDKSEQKDGSFSSADFGDTGGNGSIEQDGKTVNEKVLVRVQVNVPHNVRQVNSFQLYPYPVQPPKQRKIHAPLPEKAQALKGWLIATGYDRRQVTELHAYPFQGWRWQYAYKAALRNSGKMQPLIMPQIYAWADSMVPYAQAECERSNEVEKARQKRYTRTVQEFMTSRADIETEAVRKGMYPLDLKINRMQNGYLREGRVNVLPGNWWVVGTHKVPGLTYYWQLPLTAQEGEPNLVQLTEENALVIEGGW